MTIVLDDDDAINDLFLLKHGDDLYYVDPSIFLNFSRHFATEYQKKVNEIIVDDKIERNAFAAYVACCQGQQISASPVKLVDLLLISELWDSPMLISKIERLIVETVSSHELINLFVKLIQEKKTCQILEGIITNNLPKYIEAPRFSSITFEIIERMISNFQGKLSPVQLIRLCYAATPQGEINAFNFIKKSSFDSAIDLSDPLYRPIIELCEAFNSCPYKPFRVFLAALGNLLKQLLNPIIEYNEFRDMWASADHGNADNAFLFYQKLHPTDKIPTKPSDIAFLRLAAERGNSAAQFLYGKYLLKCAKTEENEDCAVEFLIQAAAKGVDGSSEILNTKFRIDFVDGSQHMFIYQNLALQSILLNLCKRNYNTSYQSILALSFYSEDSKLLLLSQNIMKAVQIRQRSQDQYVRLVSDLCNNEDYSGLKQSLFSLIIISMFVHEPRHTQFVYMGFLYLLHRDGVFSPTEFNESFLSFLFSSTKFLKSMLISFYWFAPLIQSVNEELFTLLDTKLSGYQEGFLGNLDMFFLKFKDSLKSMKESTNWDDFRNERDVCFYKENEIVVAIVEDDLHHLKRVLHDQNISVDQKIMNYFIDLPTSENLNESIDQEFSLIQYASMQGSNSCFLFLLKRGALFLNDNDTLSAICAACGQSKLIQGFVTNVDKEIREEMFRMAGKFNNLYLMLILMQKPIEINCRDHNGVSFSFIVHHFILLLEIITMVLSSFYLLVKKLILIWLMIMELLPFIMLFLQVNMILSGYLLIIRKSM